jgi:hypothetical protein
VSFLTQLGAARAQQELKRTKRWTLISIFPFSCLSWWALLLA